MNEVIDSLKDHMDEENYQKIKKIDNLKLCQFVIKYIQLSNPDKVFVCDDSPKDINYIREKTIKDGEETKLAIEGHTIHFDSYDDQGRDKENTRILIPNEVKLDPSILTKDRDEGLKEIHEILKDTMKGKNLYICFFCLGPVNSEFSTLCVQLTDSSYVVHNETLLYRPGYKEFVKEGSKANFFKFIHSQGELDERKTSKNLEKRRIYIDLNGETVYSANTQYGGNSIGLKKLAMRLAINKGSGEGWLTEHMLLMGIHGDKGRVTYLAGAFPSLCGKTSTAMLDGESIVGDDIAYFRKKDGRIRAVNVEKGMFGIIQGVNSKDDPWQWKALNNPGEVIFSNVLMTEAKAVHWIGKDGEIPASGDNHSGNWWIGKKDKNGKEIPCSHPNARFTLGLKILDNVDPKLDHPDGVLLEGIVYGGRDSDTCVPVEESFNWVHGIVTKGAFLESETTAATLGKEGIREFNPMSNLDFLSIPIGKYIQISLDFEKDLNNPPKIFSVNYFLKNKEGQFLNEKTDKKVWYKWMVLRIHNEVDIIETPTGGIPKYEDLKRLFQEVLSKNYTWNEYKEQFTVRIPENLAKLDRIKKIYETQVLNSPQTVHLVAEEQRERLIKAKEKFGDYISPDLL
ncbi:phosphoenolpyruvate carboxykinase (GTP) [bacterium]|nr:phosphoenolpyruvate carboxykinase (GTP) [bacterium]